MIRRKQIARTGTLMLFRQSSPAPVSSSPLAEAAAPAAAGSPPVTATGSSRGVILVVDDSGMIRGAVTKTLQSQNYEVVQGDNGRTGLAEWEKRQADIQLVVSDVFMPEMDGLTLGRELRRRSPKLPIILMSSKLDEDSRWIAEEAGFRLLPKPFKDALLIELVARMIRLRAAT